MKLGKILFVVLIFLCAGLVGCEEHASTGATPVPSAGDQDLSSGADATPQALSPEIAALNKQIEELKKQLEESVKKQAEFEAQAAAADAAAKAAAEAQAADAKKQAEEAAAKLAEAKKETEEAKVALAAAEEKAAAARAAAAACTIDGTCNIDAGETPQNCPKDCGRIGVVSSAKPTPPPDTCGNGTCDTGERKTCPGDCIQTSAFGPPLKAAVNDVKAIKAVDVYVFAATDAGLFVLRAGDAEWSKLIDGKKMYAVFGDGLNVWAGGEGDATGLYKLTWQKDRAWTAENVGKSCLIDTPGCARDNGPGVVKRIGEVLDAKRNRVILASDANEKVWQYLADKGDLKTDRGWNSMATNYVGDCAKLPDDYKVSCNANGNLSQEVVALKDCVDEPSCASFPQEERVKLMDCKPVLVKTEEIRQTSLTGSSDEWIADPSKKAEVQDTDCSTTDCDALVKLEYPTECRIQACTNPAECITPTCLKRTRYTKTTNCECKPVYDDGKQIGFKTNGTPIPFDVGCVGEIVSKKVVAFKGLENYKEYAEWRCKDGVLTAPKEPYTISSAPPLFGGSLTSCFDDPPSIKPPAAAIDGCEVKDNSMSCQCQLFEIRSKKLTSRENSVADYALLAAASIPGVNVLVGAVSLFAGDGLSSQPLWDSDSKFINLPRTCCASATSGTCSHYRVLGMWPTEKPGVFSVGTSGGVYEQGVGSISREPIGYDTWPARADSGLAFLTLLKGTDGNIYAFFIQEKGNSIGEKSAREMAVRNPSAYKLSNNAWMKVDLSDSPLRSPPDTITDAAGNETVYFKDGRRITALTFKPESPSAPAGVRTLIRK